MNSAQPTNDAPSNVAVHRGPHLGLLAIAFTLLFNLGLSFVISFSPEKAHFPGPWETSDVIAAFFQHHPWRVQMCAFFQFGAAIPLGIFTASIVSRLHFLGVRAAGPHIALFGGIVTATTLAISALSLWVLAYPDVAQDTGVLRALYYFGFAVGGVGFSVPFGLLMAGVSVSAGCKRLLPKWLVVFGIGLGIIGELSWLYLIVPQALFLIPLTRFPGLLWMIFTGFALPNSKRYSRATIVRN